MSDSFDGEHPTLTAVDRGRYPKSFDEYADDVPDVDDVDDLLRAADWALHLCRADDAGHFLDAIPDACQPIDRFQARRERLLRSELAHMEHAVEAAEEGYRGVLEDAQASGDLSHECRALLDLGRLAKRRDSWEVAIEYLDRSREIARETGAAYYEGWAAFHAAGCLYDQGSVAAAETYASAVDALSRVEGRRLYALALAGRVYPQLAEGATAEAAAALDTAATIAGAFAIANDLRVIEHVRCWALFAEGLTDDLPARLADLAHEARSSGDSFIESHNLKLLVSTHLARDDVKAARDAFAAYDFLTGMTGEHGSIEHRIVSARLEAREGKPDAIDALRALRREAEDGSAALYPALTRVYIAEAVLRSDPLGFEHARRKAARAVAAVDHHWPRIEAAYLEREAARRPVRQGQGVLLVDTRGELPHYKDARRAFEEAVILTPYERAGRCVAEGAKLVGLTDSTFRRKLWALDVETGEAQGRRTDQPRKETSQTSKESKGDG